MQLISFASGNADDDDDDDDCVRTAELTELKYRERKLFGKRNK